MIWHFIYKDVLPISKSHTLLPSSSFIFSKHSVPLSPYMCRAMRCHAMPQITLYTKFICKMHTFVSICTTKLCCADPKKICHFGMDHGNGGSKRMNDQKKRTHRINSLSFSRNKNIVSIDD